MKKVEIENGTNTKSPWAESFVSIANAYETFANRHDYSLKGYLNAYGVEIKLSKRLYSGIPLIIKVEKRMESVKGSPWDLAPSQHSTIVKYYADLPPNLSRLNIKIVKNSFLSPLILLWQSLRNQPTIKGFQVFTNQLKTLIRLQDSGIINISGFYSLSAKKSKFHAKYISIAVDENAIKNQINLIENFLDELCD